MTPTINGVQAVNCNCGAPWPERFEQSSNNQRRAGRQLQPIRPVSRRRIERAPTINGVPADIVRINRQVPSYPKTVGARLINQTPVCGGGLVGGTGHAVRSLPYADRKINT